MLRDKSPYLLRRLLQVRKIDSILWNCSKIVDQQNTDIYAYHYKDKVLRDKLIQIRNLLVVQDVDHSLDTGKYVRIGRDNDGGYVMLNEFERINAAYSFGICDDISWDLFFAKRGIDVYMYDHTIKRLPRRNKKFHWFKLGVCGERDKRENMDSLNGIIRSNGHENANNLILKMDIEGWEWKVFPDIDEDVMNCFDQIVCEFHGMYKVDNLDSIIRSLDNLNRTHQLIHIHANNNCSVLKLDELFMPDLIEVTYVKKNSHSFVESDRFFPTNVDQRNNVFGQDLPMGYWNRSI